MKETRYSSKDAEHEASQLSGLVGQRGSTKDYELARQIIDEDRKAGSPEFAKEWEKGHIQIYPSHMDKHVMIGINTTDKHLFRLFNIAAGKVTKKYKGFNQIHDLRESGTTAWELWDLPKDVHSTQVVDEIYAEMRELEPGYKEFFMFEDKEREKNDI